MHRTRKESPWNFVHYPNIESFLSQKISSAAHSVTYRGFNLDILVEDRGSPVTLVVFHSAVSDTITTYPVFAGRSMAEDTNANLVSVSDPSLAIPEVFLAWHLGNKMTGPLKGVWSRLLNHVLDCLQSNRTILFGTSGGAFAAANLAEEFPGCIAFLVNPRITFHRMAKGHLSNYFQLCQGRERVSTVSDSHLSFMSQFGITDLSQAVTPHMNYYFAIYQNLGDTRFLTQQVLPTMEAIGSHPKVQVRFSPDSYGHTSIPGITLRSILSSFASELALPEVLEDAGFAVVDQAIVHALTQYPRVIEERTKYITQVRRLKRRLSQQKEDLNTKIIGAIARNKKTKQELANARMINDKLSSENQKLNRRLKETEEAKEI